MQKRLETPDFECARPCTTTPHIWYFFVYLDTYLIIYVLAFLDFFPKIINHCIIFLKDYFLDQFFQVAKKSI